MTMQPRRAVPDALRAAIVVLVTVLSAGPATRATADEIDALLPPIAAGSDADPVVTVASRLRPGYDPIGVRLGSWVLSPALTESNGYNSNVTGFSGGRGSSFVRTTGSIDAAMQSSGNTLAAAVSVDNLSYLDLARQSYTDWTASLGGTHKLGRGEMTLAYSHLDLHEVATDFGALQSDTPVAYHVEDVRLFDALPVGRMTVTPMLEVQHFSFGNTTVLGVPVDLRSLDRDVVSADVTLNYPLSERRSVVIVGQAIDNSYERRAAGQPTETSHSGRLLVGLDEAGRGPWRYRALAGVEIRSFAAPQYATRVAPIAEGSVTWTPNGQTSVRLTLTRTIEDPTDEGVAGYVSTRATLVADRELRRNLLLQVTGGVQNAAYLQGGASQTNLLAGASLTRLLNRRARLIASYSFNDQHGADQLLAAGVGAPSELRGGNYKRQIVSLAVKLAL